MRPEAVDIETEAAMNIAGAVVARDVSLWPVLRSYIMDRCERYRAGLRHAPRWFALRLREIDPLLQLRWDFSLRCWVVDRFSPADDAWAKVVIWKEDGVALPLDNRLLDALHEGDMWRFPSAAAYLRHKRAQSAAVRARNDRQSTEKVLEVVDSLSSKQITEFIEVERAIQTGETIVAHGPALKTLEHMEAGGRRAAAAGIAPVSHVHAINPGAHPRTHKHLTPEGG